MTVMILPSVHKLYCYVKAVLQTKDCNIFQVFDADFQFLDLDELPDDIGALCYLNSVKWVHNYEEASVDKHGKPIRGDAFLKTTKYGNIV